MRRTFAHLAVGVLSVALMLALSGCPCPDDEIPEPTAEATATDADALVGEDIALEEPVEEYVYIEPTTPEFESIHFEYDQYGIRSQDEATLGRIASYLREHPETMVLIEGHCDERGTNEYNMALGEQRALAARRYLVGLGVDSGRLTTISYGEERPIDIRETEDAWAKNRRAEFQVSG
jgi:peptidoglycan-associated lipoprotein